MKIGMILLSDKSFPRDIRVEKEADALLKNGHEVAVLANRMKSNEPERETLQNGLTVFRSNVSKKCLLTRAWEKLTLVHKRWFSELEGFVKEFQPDVLHVHDFPLVPTVVQFNKKHRLPLVADLHENMPAALVAYRHDDHVIKRLFLFFADNYYLWKCQEKRYLRKCDKIVVVVEEAAHRLIDDYGISKEKICIVSNTEDETTFDTTVDEGALLDRYGDNWVALYAGGLGAHRGLDTAIKSVPMVAKEVPNFKLVIIGVLGEEQRRRICELSERTGSVGYVEALDWVHHNEVKNYISMCDVALVPHNDFEHTNTTVPHKLFQYMLMKKPVVVSDCVPLKRIVTQTGSGLVFKANDPKDLANCLIRLHGEKGLGIRLAENGFIAARGSYSWKHDKERLLDMYGELKRSH